MHSSGVNPLFSFPVTNNVTPYTQCLADLGALPANNLPVFAVGPIEDKTGQLSYDQGGHALSQGVAEMMVSAFATSGKVNLVERQTMQVPLTEVRLAEQERLSAPVDKFGPFPASDFYVVGALTELNYNLLTGGAQTYIDGIGGGARMVVMNVALDIRVVETKTLIIRYATSLQKQIYGEEIEANVFRIFGTTLVEFGGGVARNEPTQLAVRAVAEMAVYQILTDFLGLPPAESCLVGEDGRISENLDRLAPPVSVSISPAD